MNFGNIYVLDSQVWELSPLCNISTLTSSLLVVPTFWLKSYIFLDAGVFYSVQ